MVSPLATRAACSEPELISTYLSPMSPSDRIAATESFLMTCAVSRRMSMTTFTFSLGYGGSWIRATVPSWMPATRTSAPSFRPATLSNSALRRYVELNRNRMWPIQKIPAPKARSVTTMNTPKRNVLDIPFTLRVILTQKSPHKLVPTLLQICKGTFRNNGSFTEEHQTIGEQFCGANIVRNNESGHLPLLFQLQDKVADFIGGDRVEPGGWFIEEQNFGIEN